MPEASSPAKSPNFSHGALEHGKHADLKLGTTAEHGQRVFLKAGRQEHHGEPWVGRRISDSQLEPS